jgi:hypothetical protein
MSERIRLHVWGWFRWLPDRAYYRVGDMLGLTWGGWRPLHMRYPEHLGKSRSSQ